jgi:hypothetical protein
MIEADSSGLAEVGDQSESTSKRGLKRVKRQLQITPKTRGHPNPHRGGSLPKFEDILDAYVKGRTVEELSQQFNLKPETIKAKLASLELAKLRLQTSLQGQGEQASGDSTPRSGVQKPKSFIQTAPSGQERTTATAQKPTHTYMVPEGNAGNKVSTSSAGASGDGDEGTGESTEIPIWMRRDGRETVNTIEMAIRGVQSKETFSPITILLLSYLKYLGGEQMKDASFGFMVDWAVRKLCKEKGIDIQIGRSVLPDDIRI